MLFPFELYRVMVGIIVERKLLLLIFAFGEKWFQIDGIDVGYTGVVYPTS
jgi:hypothetical protein